MGGASEALDSWADDEATSNVAAVTLLWQLSEVERGKLVQLAPSLVQILLGLLGSFSAGVRAAASGTLLNLAGGERTVRPP